MPWRKKKEKEKEEEGTLRKIIFCGLDNSGKTSFIARLKNQMFQSGPTTGVDRSQYDIFGFPILVWDFGGQKKLRTSYLQKTYFFDGTDLLFYMIDIQDEARFVESLSYFEQLLAAITEKPLIIVLFHKADPDIIASQKTKEHMDQIKDRLKKPLKQFEAYFYSSTIFDYVSIITPFSFALSKLLPFASILDSYIINFLERQQLSGILLMDNTGIVLSEFAPKPKDLTLCEVTGTHLVHLFEDYRKKALALPKVSLEVPPSAGNKARGRMLFQQLEIMKSRYYLTILTRNLDKIKAIQAALEEFVQGLIKTIELSK
ncbi:MAG: ADP-ribosylation factor-like protein [Candidatus Helarchaeota archaeon]